MRSAMAALRFQWRLLYTGIASAADVSNPWVRSRSGFFSCGKGVELELAFFLDWEQTGRVKALAGNDDALGMNG